MDADAVHYTYSAYPVGLKKAQAKDLCEQVLEGQLRVMPFPFNIKEY